SRTETVGGACPGRYSWNRYLWPHFDGTEKISRGDRALSKSAESQFARSLLSRTGTGVFGIGPVRAGVRKLQESHRYRVREIAYRKRCRLRIGRQELTPE